MAYSVASRVTLTDGLCNHHCPPTVFAASSKYFCFQIRPCIIYSAIRVIVADELYKLVFYLLTVTYYQLI